MTQTCITQTSNSSPLLSLLLFDAFSPPLICDINHPISILIAFVETLRSNHIHNNVGGGNQTDPAGSVVWLPTSCAWRLDTTTHHATLLSHSSIHPMNTLVMREFRYFTVLMRNKGRFVYNNVNFLSLPKNSSSSCDLLPFSIVMNNTYIKVPITFIGLQQFVKHSFQLHRTLLCRPLTT